MKRIVLVVAILIVFVLGFGFRNEVVYLANALNVVDFFNQRIDPAEHESNRENDPDDRQLEQEDPPSGEETQVSDDQSAESEESADGEESEIQKPKGDSAGEKLPASEQPAERSGDGGSASGSEGKPRNQQPADFLILVNKQVKLPADYVPENLVIPNIPFPFSGTHEKMYMQADAASALEKLFAQARKENIYLYGLSGYRSYQTQKDIFAYNVRRFGSEAEANKISARPGESEHQTGLAMDITAMRVNFQLVTEFADTPEGKWVKENAHKFGFIIRYPQGKEDITGYVYEPWHLRYVGVECATEIYTRGITLEEYLQEK